MTNNNLISNNDYKLLIDIFKHLYLENVNLEAEYILPSNKKIKFNNITYNQSNILKYIRLLFIHNDFRNYHQTNTICTVLKIVRNEHIINYTYVYGIINNNHIQNKFIITSNSLISKDGEYKHRMLDINKLNLKHKLIDEIYNYIIQELKNKEFDFGYETFNISNKKLKKKYHQELQNQQLHIKTYIITWVCELNLIYSNQQEINKNDLYNNIVFSNKDIDVFKKIYKKHPKCIAHLIKEFTFYDSNIKLELGQKIIPFNYIQLKEYNNIIHFQWKELLINKIITNLIFNSNSPCFSIFSNWFLIQNSNKCLYDNAELYKKILYSDKIKQILNNLYLVKNNLIDLKNLNEKEKILNALLINLNKIISISESTMLMSNISLCYFSEYSGKTFYDYLIKLNNKQINNNIGDIFSDYNIFSKYLFELIYSLYCLNLKGIIHGDLHLNNVTFSIHDKILNNNFIVYDLNNNINNDILHYINNYRNITNIRSSDTINTNNNCYIFKNTNTYPTIIDYSRSFVLINLIDENIIEQDKNKIRDLYIKTEKKRIINELNKIFPNYIKNNSHKIKFLFLNKNFNILFIYFSAYDIFTFSTNLLIFLKKISINNNSINPKIIELLTKISKKSYYYLEQMIDDNNYNSNNKFQFPNYLLLQEFFKDFIINDNNINNTINNFYDLKNINNYYNLNSMKDKLKETILNFNNEEKKIPNIISRFNNILNFNKTNNELFIEKIINNEYYKIKSNLHLITSSVNKSMDNTFDVTTNSLVLSNF